MTTRKTAIQPRDVSDEQAARRLGLVVAEFNAKLPNLRARGFPQPDPDTGLFDMVAIDKWCDARHPHLFGGAIMRARDAGTVARDRIEKMRAVAGHRG